MAVAFPHISTAGLETLLSALDLKRSDPGSLADGLADPPAFLARIGLEASHVSLVTWLKSWRAAGGSQEALLMTVQALLDQRRADFAARSIELVWSGPDAGAGSITRDQSVLIRQLVERAQQRLLLTTYAFYKGPFINELFQLIRGRMLSLPKLQVRMICNIHRDRGDSTSPEALIRKFQQQTWSRLWPEPLLLPCSSTPVLYPLKERRLSVMSRQSWQTKNCLSPARTLQMPPSSQTTSWAFISAAPSTPMMSGIISND